MPFAYCSACFAFSVANDQTAVYSNR